MWITGHGHSAHPCASPCGQLVAMQNGFPAVFVRLLTKTPQLETVGAFYFGLRSRTEGCLLPRVKSLGKRNQVICLYFDIDPMAYFEVVVAR